MNFLPVMRSMVLSPYALHCMSQYHIRETANSNGLVLCDGAADLKFSLFQSQPRHVPYCCRSMTMHRWSPHSDIDIMMSLRNRRVKDIQLPHWSPSSSGYGIHQGPAGWSVSLDKGKRCTTENLAECDRPVGGGHGRCKGTVGLKLECF